MDLEATPVDTDGKPETETENSPTDFDPYDYDTEGREEYNIGEEEEEDGNEIHSARHGHHRTFSDIIGSVEAGCQVCRTFWLRLSEEQCVIRDRDRSSPRGRPGGSSHGYLTHALISTMLAGTYWCTIKFNNAACPKCSEIEARFCLYPITGQRTQSDPSMSVADLPTEKHIPSMGRPITSHDTMFQDSLRLARR